MRAVTAPPGPWLRATDAGAAPCSANQTSLDDALNRARHGVGTALGKERKVYSNFGVEGVLKEGAAELSSHINAFNACEPAIAGLARKTRQKLFCPPVRTVTPRAPDDASDHSRSLRPI